MSTGLLTLVEVKCNNDIYVFNKCDAANNDVTSEVNVVDRSVDTGGGEV